MLSLYLFLSTVPTRSRCLCFGAHLCQVDQRRWPIFPDLSTLQRHWALWLGCLQLWHTYLYRCDETSGMFWPSHLLKHLLEPVPFMVSEQVWVFILFPQTSESFFLPLCSSHHPPEFVQCAIRAALWQLPVAWGLSASTAGALWPLPPSLSRSIKVLELKWKRVILCLL